MSTSSQLPGFPEGTIHVMDPGPNYRYRPFVPFLADVVRLSDVARSDVEWLWPGRIALGKLTLLAGDPGLGKSYLALEALGAGIQRSDAGFRRHLVLCGAPTSE